MKQKIKEALQQGSKNLGLSEEVFERVATSVETLITDEADIERVVNSDLVKNLLKFEQSDADRKRTKRLKGDKEGEGEKQTDNGKVDTEPKKETETPKAEFDVNALVERLNSAWEEKLKPLQEELTAFKSAQKQSGAISALEELRKTWDYAKGYPTESEEARIQVMDLYEATGKVWDSEKLTSEYKRIFNRQLSKIGVDTGKPFKSEGSDKGVPDFSKEVEILKAAGVDLPE